MNPAGRISPLLLLLPFLALQVQGERPFLHPLFSDHAVLQQRKEIPVWGWTEPGAEVIVSLAHQMMLAKADESGRWEVRLGPFAPGGPHELKVQGLQEAVVGDVMIGEVWLCSGQSNMEWPVSLSQNPEEEIGSADHPGIRLLTVPKRISAGPVESFEASWQVCSPETVADFSAVGYYFGRSLHQETGVPVGLIDATWGGTVAEAWVSGQGIGQLADFGPALSEVARWRGEEEEILRRYAESIQAWWKDNDPGSAPDAMWSRPSLGDSDWPEMQLPGHWEGDALPDFDGVVWFRKSFGIPALWEGSDLILHLARIDDGDTTFVNGHQVGSTLGWNTERRYRIPAGLLRKEGNVIAVRVLDTNGEGGFHGRPDEMYLAPAEGARPGAQPLSGWWKWKRGKERTELKPLPQPPGSSPNRVTVLYNGMIAPLVPYALRGAAWYQGESNAGRPTQYRTLLPTLIGDWRARFGQGDFPFLIVQLANFMQREAQPAESRWAALREAQDLAARNDPMTGLAVAIDIGEAGDIHPRNKQEVGRRLALEALRIAYGREDLVSQGPVFSGMVRNGASLVLSFDSVGSGLVARGGDSLEGFAVAGSDGRYVWAQARIEADRVVVASPEVEEPRSVRYAWANNPGANLYNREGLPAAPFRSDVEAAEIPGGFVPLFDGESLEGFEQINGSAVYEVVDGAILGTTTQGSPNSFLCTTRRFRDFELQFEVNLINPQLNSGVQIRSNSYAHDRGGRVHGYQVEISSNGHAGFVYDEARRGWLSTDRSDPKARGAFRTGDWNHYRILCQGDRIRTWVNHVPVADVTDSMTAEGFIGLQVHGVRGDPHWQVAWRNLWIREIEEDLGTPLFDGESLKGWTGSGRGWHVDSEGNLSRGEEPGGYLWTEESFGDFELRAEFRVSPGCNSGIFFRTDPGNPVQGGFEMQILDSHGKASPGKHDSGSLYDVLAPRVNSMRAAGEWNSCRIRAVGSEVAIYLNGERVVEADLSQWTEGNANPDGSRNKFRTPLAELPLKGHIGLQDHGHPVSFRNLYLRRL